MAIWKLKGCPRCGGDLFHDRLDKWFVHCLQCGYAHELKRDAGRWERIAQK